ncbi:MAG TPA: MBOAT family O-acyltransferase [Acetobacteraceae bacterium]|nr:MBOAT family O-acyltransferase [Acetobacteraceae bacterium]
MLFHSQPFVLGFLPVCLIGCALLGRYAGRTASLAWLFCASLFFYGWWNPSFVLLLLGSIATNYALSQQLLRLARTGRRTAVRCWLIAGIAGNLSLLGWFKYADFLLHVAAPHAPPLGIFLPLAISFFTFQQIMFLVESARQEHAGTTPLTYATFVAFFPHLIAGPIVRPKDIIPQLERRDLALRPDNLAEGTTLFLLGLAKKLVLADTFGSFADTGFNAAAAGAHLTFFEAWYALLAYSLQIYFDFSGYSDMAIGLAHMLNVRFPLNFDSPYQSRNIAEFWRRWHITLGSFLREYVFIPLGGSRCGTWRHSANLLATMLLCGLWHGAAWRFVIWGGLHGLYLVAHARCRVTMPAALARALTLLAVVVAWVPFRAASGAAAWDMLAGMAGLHGLALPQMIVQALPILGHVATPAEVLPCLGDARTLSFPQVSACLLLGWAIVLLLPHVHALSERARTLALTSSFALSVQALLFAPSVAPFLYFRF